MTQKFGTFLLLLLCCAVLFAGDNEARETIREARSLENAKKYSAAAKNFLTAQIQADDPVLKFNALKSAARCNRKAGAYGAEFDCIQTLVKRHLSRINFKDAALRQYEIGNEYFKGHRDRYLSWLPFIRKDDRTMEIYETALKNAPTAAPAAQARLRLGRLYIDDGKYDKAIQSLSEAIKLDSDPKITRYAALELSNVFGHLASRGDGDSKNAELAIDAFDSFLKQHPDSPEAGWVKRSRADVRETVAKRYRDIGNFYYDKGKPEVAERYFATVIKEFPDTRETANAEQMLAKIDKEYKVKGIPIKPLGKRAFTRMEFPQEASPVLVSPLNSGNRWLLPVRDLKAGEVDSNDIKLEITDEML